MPLLACHNPLMCENSFQATLFGSWHSAASIVLWSCVGYTNVLFRFDIVTSFCVMFGLWSFLSSIALSRSALVRS